MKSKRLLRITAATLLTAVLTSALMATPAGAVGPDAYLDDFTAEAGTIVPQNGNFSTNVGDARGFSWSAQAVLDNDLLNSSVNGFLESVWPTGAADEAGSGHLSIQHWFGGGDQLVWRIPIALDTAVGDVQATIVFDDPDWTPNLDSFKQFSTHTSQPGYESAFHRFTGITGYAPHDDTRTLPAEWGTNDAGHSTLTVSLGDIEAGTSTVIQFTGTAISGGGLSGAENIAAGVAYGVKLTVDGTRQHFESYSVEYEPLAVRAGDTITASPVTTNKQGEPIESLPAGTVYSLTADAPNGFDIDPVTGVIKATIPADASDGTIEVPVTIEYPDATETILASTNSVVAQFDVTAAPVPAPPVEPDEAPVTTPTPNPETPAAGFTDLDFPAELEYSDAFTSVFDSPATTPNNELLRVRDVRQESSAGFVTAVGDVLPAESSPTAAPGQTITVETTRSPLVPILVFALGGVTLGALGTTMTGRNPVTRGLSRALRVGVNRLKL